ncbi:MAG TPA: hypothetical protein VNO82_20470, partial [Solirubrobacteraceae bacterium]|nr:hypothetical protein [Solirubrobacteraceae bacterium]
SITIDNPPRGAAIETGNAGTPGLLDAGDWVRLTWTEQIAPASVLAGWSGTGQAIVVRIRDNVADDQMDFYATSGGARLNLVLGAADLNLDGNFVTGGDAEFNATMSQSGPSITITLGTKLSGTLATATAGTLTWRPSNGARDLGNNASSTTTVTEGGALDVDL